MSEVSDRESPPAEQIARLERELTAARLAWEQCSGKLKQLEQDTLEPLSRQVQALRAEFHGLQNALEAWHRGGQEGSAPWLEALREAARSAQAAMERLAILDSTQAASLASVGEELRALRAELEQRKAWFEPGASPEDANARARDWQERCALGHSRDDPMLEIARMHLELLRALVERVVPAPVRGGAPSGAAAGSGPLTGEAESNEPAESSAPARRTSATSGLGPELRGVLASLEYQISELREEQQRQVQQWQRRIEDIRQAMDQSSAHEHGRRLAWAVALGLVFTVATASLGLLWYRGQGSGEAWQEARNGGRTSARPSDARDADYRELLSEAEVAMRQGEWAKAESALEQALRLRPDAREAQLALAALRESRSGSRPLLGGTGSSEQSAAPGLRCQLRDGRLCCTSGSEPEQCVAWTQAEAQGAAAPPTPTVRPRQRIARPTMPGAGTAEADGDVF